MDVTIYHNPACGTSRKVLVMIRDAGIEPQIIDYLNALLTPADVEDLIARSGLPARALLREKEALCAELGLCDTSTTDAALIDAIAAHPVLLNRPVVVTPHGAAVCRPAETVLPMLQATGG